MHQVQYTTAHKESIRTAWLPEIGLGFAIKTYLGMQQLHPLCQSDTVSKRLCDDPPAKWLQPEHHTTVPTA